MLPPVIVSSKTKSSSSICENLINTSPYCPCPPDCFLCFPWTSEVPLIVSLYGTFNSTVFIVIPNFAFNFSITVAQWSSPCTPRIVWFVSRFLCHLNAGSSSIRRLSPNDIFSSSFLFRGSIATNNCGFGKVMSFNKVSFSLADNVSEVPVLLNFENTTMSPAIPFWISSILFVTNVFIFPIFSFVFLLMLKTSLSCLISPE